MKLSGGLLLAGSLMVAKSYGVEAVLQGIGKVRPEWDERANAPSWLVSFADFTRTLNPTLFHGRTGPVSLDSFLGPMGLLFVVSGIALKFAGR